MDVEGKRLIIIGDSHVDGNWFGQALELSLEARGAEVVRYGWGGSAASTWIAGRRIFKKQYSLQVIRGDGPYDAALVVLGSNDAANAQRASMEGGRSLREGVKIASSDIRKVADSLGAVKSFWVGPPAMGSASPYWTNAAVDALWQETAPKFGKAALDSRAATLPHVPKGDGIHLGRGGAEAWAQFVVTEVTKQEASMGGPEPIVLLLAAGIVVLAQMLRRKWGPSSW
jgi:hypothetical protein